ncbi:MAG: hypothetical protein WD009_09695 [Phycisphaeraceae bacterium]
MPMADALHIHSVRPLVRYVDEQQAIIEAQVTLGWDPARGGPAPTLTAAYHIRSADGFEDEGEAGLSFEQGVASLRVELVQPQRWWPAGMGEQALYELTIELRAGRRRLSRRRVTLGLTSVRSHAAEGSAGAGADADNESRLLVNGQVCEIRSVVLVDRVDEAQLLPASGDALLLVRDHYAPDVLYDAADRAGVLLVQAVPVHPQGTPEVDVEAQVDRLGTHPSLAGWFVGHLGRLSGPVAARLRQLDPARSVFHDFPADPAA